MADVITRFKLETTQYDSKLRDASKSLAEYTRKATQAGNEFGKFTQKNVEAARALGNITPSATNAKDKVKELVGAFNDAARAYNALTKEQQQSDFGKALAASLDQLKVRIQNSKTELDDINKSLNGGGGLSGALDNIAGKFGMSVQSLASWGTALAAARGALEVAKDAFFASEATVDEWGRVMDSSKSLYEGFLTSLNTGDISGFLNRIDSIVQAARAAYNELDRLGTMKTIQAPQMSAQQTENERMRMMIQTGRYIAPVDGRRASMQNGQLLTPDQIKRIEQQLQGGMQKVVTLVGNEVAQTGRAIDAVYNRQAQELGMSLSEFRKGTSSMAEFDKRMAGYQKYEQWRKDNSFTDAWGNRQVRPGNPYEEYKKWNTFRVDGDRYNDLVKLIQQRDQQAGSLYGMQSQAYRTMNRAEGITLRQLMGGGSGGGRSGGGKTTTAPTFAADSIAAQAKLVSDLQKKWNEAGGDMRTGYLYQLIEAENKLKSMKDEQKALRDMTTWGDLKGAPVTGLGESSFSGKSLKDLQGVKLELKLPKEKTEASLTKEVGNMAGGISQMVGSMEALGIELPEGMKNVVNGVTSLISIVSGIATIVTAIEALTAADTVIPFARGGVVHAANGFVQGNNYSGDMIPAALNAGELVLNKAQQGNLASQLQGAGFGGVNMVGEISGESIKIVLNRHLKRTGQGEIVTW